VSRYQIRINTICCRMMSRDVVRHSIIVHCCLNTIGK
jgi:hypothetical protein